MSGRLRLSLILVLVYAGLLSAGSHSQHSLLRVVPVPGEAPAIDGRLADGEWDRSGEMLVFSAKPLRDRYSVRTSAMWNAEALYLAFSFRDPVPLVNNVNAETEIFGGWQSDAVQLRFVTDRGQIHLDAWYSSDHDKSLVVISYDKAANNENHKLYRHEGKAFEDASGVAMALRETADGKGYVQELRIPWKLLVDDLETVRAGKGFTFTSEYYWGSPEAKKWPGVMWSDPVNPAQPVRVTLYLNPGAWGRLRLLAHGNVPREDEDEASPLYQGPVTLRAEVPAGAKRFSLAIDDAQGRRVRNLIAHAKVSDYTVGREGDRQVIELPWDGRSDGGWDKRRRLFVGPVVPAGRYTLRVLVHEGVGVRHAGSFCNPGTPPWPTVDGSGAWMADHAGPMDVTTIRPASQAKARVFLAAAHAECGSPLIGLDATGRKVWQFIRGMSHIHAIAANDRALFVGLTYGGNQRLLRLNPSTGESAPFASGREEMPLDGEVVDVAACEKVVALSLKGGETIELRDSVTGLTSGSLPVAEARELCFDAAGRLWGRAGEELFAADVTTLEVRRYAVPDDIEPGALGAGAGRLFLSDRRTKTVHELAVAGDRLERVRRIGTPGGRPAGPFDPEQMAQPAAVAVQRSDKGDTLWVVEGNWFLRRVVGWDLSTSPVAVGHDLVGNTTYMGSGAMLSDDDPTMGLFRGTIFEIDYDRYDYRPVQVMGGRPDPQPGKTALFKIGSGLHPIGFGSGRHFRSDAAGGEPLEYLVEGGGLKCVFMRRGDRWHCVAVLGHRNHKVDWPEGFPTPADGQTVFAWSDRNDDGYQQPDEVVWAEVPEAQALKDSLWDYRCDDQLRWYHSGVAFEPVGFTERGAPIYDPRQARRLPGELGRRFDAGSADIHRTRFGYVTVLPKPDHKDPHGTMWGLMQLEGYDNDGRRRWTYPCYWYSVHGAMTAPAPMPGVIMGMLKYSGLIELDGHDVIALRGNTGQEFLIRDDGMYVGELFTDQRLAPERLGNDERIAGQAIDGTSMGGEPFSGWVSRQSDGTVRLTYGYTDARIAEVVGLDTVRELPASTVSLSDEQVARCKLFQPVLPRGEPRRTWIAQGSAFDPGKVTFDNDGLRLRSAGEVVSRVRLAWDARHLHVAWKVDDPTPMVNAGRDATIAFKSGDCVSVFLAESKEYARGTQAGTRVLLTWMDGQCKAVVYRPSGPGRAPKTFSSPVRSTRFAYVRETDAVQAALRRTADGYVVTASIPFDVLAVEPASGKAFRGDVGVIFGRETTSHVDRIVRWADEQTNVVNDTPTEAEFFPARWGDWTLENGSPNPSQQEQK